MKRFFFSAPLLIVLSLSLTSVLLARVHPFGDAGLYSRYAGSPLPLAGSDVPPEVRSIFAAKCADCHSARPRVPFYGRLAPASWLMESDIIRAQSAMNLSEWQDYSAAQQEVLKAKIARQARLRAMPPIQYRLIHWNSRVSDVELKTLLRWAGDSDPAEDTEAALPGDANRGKAVFERRCTGCHALNTNREGPRLGDVYGRTSGTAPNFDYSPALKKAGITWNETTLERWLTDPDAFVPDNNMDFHVAKPQERRDIIEFLKENGK